MAKKKLEESENIVESTDIWEGSEDFQKTINDLKEANLKLQGEKAQLLAKITSLENAKPKIETIEKIVEVPVEVIVEKPIEKIVEKIVYVNETNDKNVIDDFIGKYVYYPSKYQRMRFEVKKISGKDQDTGSNLYRIISHENGITENYVRKVDLMEF